MTKQDPDVRPLLVTAELSLGMLTMPCGFRCQASAGDGGAMSCSGRSDQCRPSLSCYWCRASVMAKELKHLCHVRMYPRKQRNKFAAWQDRICSYKGR